MEAVRPKRKGKIKKKKIQRDADDCVQETERNAPALETEAAATFRTETEEHNQNDASEPCTHQGEEGEHPVVEDDKGTAECAEEGRLGSRDAVLQQGSDGCAPTALPPSHCSEDLGSRLEAVKCAPDSSPQRLGQLDSTVAPSLHYPDLAAFQQGDENTASALESGNVVLAASVAAHSIAPSTREEGTTDVSNSASQEQALEPGAVGLLWDNPTHDLSTQDSTVPVTVEMKENATNSTDCILTMELNGTAVASPLEVEQTATDSMLSSTPSFQAVDVIVQPQGISVGSGLLDLPEAVPVVGTIQAPSKPVLLVADANATVTEGSSTADSAVATVSLLCGTKQAGVVTEQAGVATEQVGVATEQVGVATEQAGVATEQVGVVTEQVRVVTEQAGVVTEQVGVATEQVGVVTEQAGVATEQVGVVTEQVGVATEQAGVATEQAGVATEVQLSGVPVMAPFTEQELAALYCNPQLDANSVFVDNFILQCKQEHHPLYSLLLQYLKANLALTTSKKAVEGYQKDFAVNQQLIWTIIQKELTLTGKCLDNAKVSHTHVYNYAVFNTDAMLKANVALKSIRETLQDDLCMRSYSSQLARIHVLNYLHRLIQTIPEVLHFDPTLLKVTSWVPQCVPGQIDHGNSALRDCISVLFIFQRRPPQDQQFSEDCMLWLDILLSILLRIATLSDHQFIFNHLLRCPPGVGRWGAKYVHISSPLNTDLYMAPFKPRGFDDYTMEEQDAYAREWNIGQGLHQDWGGPLLDHFVNMLATLLLPVKQREEFLCLLAIPRIDQIDDSQAWTFIDDTLEESESEQHQFLLKESDLMAFFDQFPFGDMYQHILQIKNGDFYAERCSSYAMLRLIAFCTCLIRLLGAAFSTMKLLRYKEFVKRVGRTIRQTVAYVGDHWLGYKSHHILSGEDMDAMPQGPHEAYYRYSLSRLQLEFDQFVLRATQWILAAHKLGAWQFLADLPYASVSLQAIWKMFWCLYSTPKDGTAPALVQGGVGDGIPMQQQEMLSTVEQIVDALKSTTLNKQFLDCLMTAYTSEAIFLLTTFANMARARLNTSEEEKLFINTIAVELFQCTQISPFAKDAYSHTGRSLLGSIASVHPFVLSTLMIKTEEAFKDAPEENCYQLFREMPLSLWQPRSHDINLIRDWLVQHPPASVQNRVARALLSGLNWGTRAEVGSNELVLDASIHKLVALLLVEAHSMHLPTHPGGRQYVPVQGIRKYASSLISGMTQEQAEFLSWAWEVALMLKLHPNQLSKCANSLLNPTSSSSPPEGQDSGGPAKFVRSSTRLSPGPDAWFLPPLTAAEELADLRDAVKYEGHLAFYIALCMTSIGSEIDEFVPNGLNMLSTLIEEGYYLPVLRVIANVTPRFFQQKKRLIAEPLYLQVIMALASADVANVTLRERLTFSSPQPLVSRKMGALIVTQLQTACGPGGPGGDAVLQFWLDTLLSYPNWWKERSLAYLMDILAQCVFMDLSLMKMLQKALLESYYNVQSGSVRRGSFINSVLSAVVYEGPPSIFNSIPVSNFPWLAFCTLCAEEQYEMEEGIWKALLLALKNDSKITLEAALKRVLTELKIPLFHISHLSIYRWADFCAAIDSKEPVAVLAWQKFFMLYLQRPILQESMPERDSQGWRFFAASMGATLKRKMKVALSSACTALKTALTALEQSSIDSEPLNQTAVAQLNSSIRYYQTLRLWLDEPRLHDPALYIPALPQGYDPSRLQALMEANRTSLWYDLLPFDEIKGQLNALVEEWVQVAAYQKTLPFNPESSGSQVESVLTRMQKRLLKCSKALLPPPPLQTIAAPFAIVPDDILISQDAFLPILTADLNLIVSNARTFVSKSRLLTTLDDGYISFVPERYTNPPRQFQVQVPCRQAQHKGHLCTGPANLLFTVEECALHPRCDHDLTVNRAQYEETVVTLAAPVAAEMCMTVMRMEHNVARLTQLAHQMQGSPVNFALKCGVSVFYEVLKYISLEARLFPPTCQFFTTCIQVLGQEFIHNDPVEMVNIIPVLRMQPALADILSPLFQPNQCEESFLPMYSTILGVAKNVGVSTAFSLLTKFNIPQWLSDRELSMTEGTQFMEYIIQGLAFCGTSTSSSGSENGNELLIDTYRQHFRIVLNHDFPQQYSAALRLLIDSTDQHTVTPSIWADLCSCLGSGQGRHLGLQQLHDTLQFVTNHYLQKRMTEAKTLYSIVHWDYIHFITEFLQLVCNCMVAQWKESVESAAVKHDEAVSKCWDAIRDTFEPWITSLDTNRQDVLFPCTELECVMMNSVMVLFVNCIATLHTTLKGGAQLMAYVWQYYCTHLVAVGIVPEYVLVAYHTNLVKLPWEYFFVDLSILDQVAKFPTDDLFSSSSFVFTSKIFPRLDWKHIISSYCDLGQHGENSNLPVQLHVKILQLLIMFASEKEVMDDPQTSIPELMNEAREFHWKLLDSKQYQGILEWQKQHCDPNMVLQAGSNLSVALRLLKSVAEFPTASGSNSPSTLDSWKKRQLYIQVVVELIAIVTKKLDAQTFNYSDVLSNLFETIVNISTCECSKSGSENVILLIGEILNLLNICSPVPSVVQRLVDLICVIMDELPNACLIALPLVTAGCRTLASLAIMAKIVEHAIECHFRAQSKPPSGITRLPRDPVQYGWQPVATALFLPDSSLREFLQTCVSECSVLILHAYILQKLYSAKSVQQEMELAILAVQWCTQIKPKSKEEAKVFLLWEKAINILLIQTNTSYSTAVPYLSTLATALNRSGEDKASEGILGVIGLGKKSPHSYQFRLIAKAMAAFLFCQMPVDSSQTTQLRLLPESLGHIKDRVKVPPLGAVVPTKMCEQSYNSLEQLLSNKQYAAWKELAVYSLSFINDSNNTLVNAVDLLVHLCTGLFAEYRYLDVLRTVAT